MGDPLTTAVAPSSTEERILDATVAVLARDGGRLSMSAVAEAAGIARMTLYRHYASKESLLRALARHEQRRFDGALAGALAGVDEPAARVDAMLRAIVSFLESSATRVAVAAEPGFVIDRMRRSLPVQRATIERLVGDALATVPAVRAGAATPGDLAELVLRVAMSQFLVPPADPDGVLRALRAVVRPAAEGRRR